MPPRPLSQRDSNSTPPPDGRALKDKKNLHSPWSAQRERKRPAIKCAEPLAPLTIIDEDYTSPPKRRNGAPGGSVPASATAQAYHLKAGPTCAGGTSPAARELRLSGAGLRLEERVEPAGPLAQVNPSAQITCCNQPEALRGVFTAERAVPPVVKVGAVWCAGPPVPSWRHKRWLLAPGLWACQGFLHVHGRLVGACTRVFSDAWATVLVSPKACIL